jgi:virginiamycin B lyase
LLWFVEGGPPQIGAIGSTGAVQELAAPGAYTFLTTGPDGNLWYTELYDNAIARMTPAGVTTEFPVPTSDAYLSDLTAASDGNLWFTEQRAGKIGRITTGGTITEFPVPGGQSPFFIAPPRPARSGSRTSGPTGSAA